MTGALEASAFLWRALRVADMKRRGMGGTLGSGNWRFNVSMYSVPKLVQDPYRLHTVRNL